MLRNSGRGFTLIELLVVVGIIGLLIAILLPVLGKVRLQGQQVTCQAQLRALGQSLRIYSQSQRGWLPTWSGWHTVDGDGTGQDAPGPAWTEQLARDFARPDSQVFNCPSFPADRKINYFLTAVYSYKTNRRSFRLDEVKLGSQFVLAGDCTQTRLYPKPFGDAGFTLDDADKDDASQQGVVWANEPGGINIHRKGNNLLFADGHVTFAHRFDPREMTFHPKKPGKSWQEMSLGG
jgi:prepilin-type N-terminal cleavage/methylation domain-containing protein/prepilin-type processing-associated H-X9-DG protein